VRLPTESDSSLIKEQHDMSKWVFLFKSPNDSGSFDILEQPDKPRYTRELSLLSDSGGAETREDRRRFRYCSFNSSVIDSGSLSFCIFGAMRLQLFQLANRSCHQYSRAFTAIKKHLSTSVSGFL
jgi:hypothetical protein